MPVDVTERDPEPRPPATPPPRSPWPSLLLQGVAFGFWIVVALAATALGITLLGRTPRPELAVFQMAMPFVLLALALPVLFAALTRRKVLMVAAGATFIVAALLVMPAAWPRSHPSPSDGDFTVLVANLRYNNDDYDGKVDQLMAADQDVVVLVEYTPEFGWRLDARDFRERYPYSITHPLEGAHGAAIFSKNPVRDARLEPIGRLVAPAVTVDTDAGPLRIVAVHTRPPVSPEYVPVWSDDLESLKHYARGLDTPTMLAGDFNATRWHPIFHDMLDSGLVDAHEQVGEGLSFSWPQDGRLGRVVGPFSRLDHALLFGLDATSVEDLPAVGSDHAPFVVQVRVRASGTVTP